MRRKRALSVGTRPCCEPRPGLPAAHLPATEMGCATDMRRAPDSSTADMHAAAQSRRTADMRSTMRPTAETHSTAAYAVRDSSAAHGMRDSAAAKATWTSAPAESVRGSAAADAMRSSTSASTHSVRASTTTWAASSVLRVSGTCKNGGQSNDAEDFDF